MTKYKEIDRKILKNSKDLSFEQAVFKAYGVVSDAIFGVTACGNDLLVRQLKEIKS